MITYCLKLIQQTHVNHCKTITKNSGYNRMWIVDNSVEVIQKIVDFYQIMRGEHWEHRSSYLARARVEWCPHFCRPTEPHLVFSV